MKTVMSMPRSEIEEGVKCIHGSKVVEHRRRRFIR